MKHRQSYCLVFLFPLVSMIKALQCGIANPGDRKEADGRYVCETGGIEMKPGYPIGH